VASATARLYARGRIPKTGALAPENALDFDDLAAELEPRGCTFEITTTESEVPA
jgi:hypothetical protein